MVDELGLLHARSRVDLAVINHRVLGFEIKSARDTLRRLPDQLEVYRQTLHKLTLVVEDRHLAAVTTAAPGWCGVLLVTAGPRGGIRFRRIRPAVMNPDVDPFKLAHLLWRDEARAALAERGASARDLRGPRQDLYRQLVDQVTVRELTTLIRQSMSRRRAWRPPAPSPTTHGS